MPIYQALDLSTAHMKFTDAEILEGYSVGKDGRKRPAGGTLVVDPVGDYGWIISAGGWSVSAGSTEAEVAARIQAARDEGLSDAFIGVMVYASRAGLDSVRFDSDGDPEPGLPRFDWEAGDELLPEEDNAPAP